MYCFPYFLIYFISSSTLISRAFAIFLSVSSVGFWFLPASILIIVLLATTIMLHQKLRKVNKGRKIVVCARVGGANTTPFMAAHFAKQNTKFGGGGKRGRAKIPSPQPPSFLPARAFQFCARSAQSFGVLLKKSSNFVQKTPPE